MDLKSVVAAAKHFLSLETVLHGLVNNAGIMATPFEITKDLHEAQWQTNYLAHWVFTECLLPIMLQTSLNHSPGSVRVVNLTSTGHLAAPRGVINFQDLSLKDASPMVRYSHSKLANVLQTKTLHKQYGPGSESARNGEGEVWISCVHPGVVGTNLLDSLVGDEASSIRTLLPVFRLFGMIMSADKASYTSLFLVASQDMKPEQSGTYCDVHKSLFEPSWQSSAAKDAGLAEKLEEWTKKEMKDEGWL